MKTETKYAYQKRIKELETENSRLRDALYEYKTACSDIYNGCVESLGNKSFTINISWVMERMKRVWRPTP